MTQFDEMYVGELLGRIAALEAELIEAKAQRDSWKRIAESGLGITSETKVQPPSSKPWYPDGWICNHGVGEDSRCIACDRLIDWKAMWLASKASDGG